MLAGIAALITEPVAGLSRRLAPFLARIRTAIDTEHSGKELEREGSVDGDADLVVRVGGTQDRILIEEEPAEEIIEDLVEVDTAPETQSDTEPETQPVRRWHDPRPAIAMGIGALSTRLQRHRDPQAVVCRAGGVRCRVVV